VFDADALHLFGQQHGVASTRQLQDDLGIGRSSIDRACQRGLLVRMTSSVVRIASSPDTFHARCMTVQLHLDGVGFLSGWTAGRLRGLRRMPTSTIHYTVPASCQVALPRYVALHRTRWYEAVRDREELDGFVVAVPTRMLFGLAAAFNQHRFRLAAEDAWHLGLTTPTEMADYLERHRCRGKDGVSTIERWLEHALPQHRPAQSGLEQLLLDALAQVGLPMPERQHPLVLPNGETIHLDIAWPAISLAVEPGATWWHGGDAGQRRDNERDLACSELGWQIVRLDESVGDDPTAAARRIGTIHRRRTTDLMAARSADSVVDLER
jgi:hypothetical protein